MKDIQDLVPDDETFRRVWQRVMPEERNSSIVVRPPMGNRTAPPRPKPERPGERNELEDLLRMLDEGLGLAGELRRRRMEGRAIWESLHKSAARVRSVWFLRTGRRWDTRPVPPPRGMDLRQLVRRQYLWEQEFSDRCRALERDGEDGEELAEELLRASRRRRTVLRGMLE